MLQRKKYSGKKGKNAEQSFKIFLLISLEIDTERGADLAARK